MKDKKVEELVKKALSTPTVIQIIGEIEGKEAEEIFRAQKIPVGHIQQ